MKPMDRFWKRLLAIVSFMSGIAAIAVLWYIGLGFLFLFLMAVCFAAGLGAIAIRERLRDSSDD